MLETQVRIPFGAVLVEPEVLHLLKTWVHLKPAASNCTVYVSIDIQKPYKLQSNALQSTKQSDL